MIKICPTCGKEFHPNGAQVYCSIDCKPRSKPVARTCPVCGNVFSDRKGAVFCSPACAQDEENRKSREKSVLSNNPDPLYRMVACSDCGCIAYLHIKSFRCPACQAEAERKHAAEYRAAAKMGHARKVGEYYACERCGQPYMLRGGNQRYCLACKTIAIRENISEHKKAIAASMTIEERRAKRRPRTNDFKKRIAVCPNCGKSFESSRQHRVFCSTECSDAYKPVYQQRRAPRPSISKPSTKIQQPCRICGTLFVGKKTECYCGPDCRKIGQKAYRSKWRENKRNPE